METFKIVQPINPQEEGFVDIDIAVWLGTDTIKSVTYSAQTASGADATSQVLDSGLSTYCGVHIKPYIKGGTDKTSYKVLALVECNEVSDVGAFVVLFDTKRQ
jgi:hypothetical protein